MTAFPMDTVRKIYKALRGILFTTILVLVGLVVSLYILISIPAVQDSLRSTAEKELSSLLGGRVGIGRLSVYPFNEVVLHNVSLAGPDGISVIDVSKLGAGVDLWRLLSKGEVEVTYIELIAADVRLWKESPDSPLNIDFLIKALAPKDKKKPPTKFDLRIHNVVVRNCSFSWSKRWIPASGDSTVFDLNHIRLFAVNADIELPRIKNDDFSVDLRRLAFKACAGAFEVDDISLLAHITPRSISVRNLVVKLPGTDLRPSDISLEFNGFGDIANALRRDGGRVVMLGSQVTPSDFKAFFPPLANLGFPVSLSLEAFGNAERLAVDQLKLEAPDGILSLSLSGSVSNLAETSNLSASLDSFSLEVAPRTTTLLSDLIPSVNKDVWDMLSRAGNIGLALKGDADLAARSFAADGVLDSSLGNAEFHTMCAWGNAFMVQGNLEALNFDAGTLLGKGPVGLVTLSADADITIPAKGLPVGNVSADIPSIQLSGQTVQNISLQASRLGENVDVDFSVNDPAVQFALQGAWTDAGEDSSLSVEATADNVRPGLFVPSASLANSVFNGRLSAELSGNSLDNLRGYVDLSHIDLSLPATGDLSLRSVRVDSDILPSDSDSLPQRSLRVESDWLSAVVEGDFLPSKLPALFRHLAYAALPQLLPQPLDQLSDCGSASYRVTLLRDAPIKRFTGQDITLLGDLTLSGSFSSDPGSFTLDSEVPYLLKGKDKLLRDISLSLSLDAPTHYLNLLFGIYMPAKKDDMRFDIDLSSLDGNLMLTADLNNTRPEAIFRGPVKIGGRVARDPLTGKPDIDLRVFPTDLSIKQIPWRIGASRIQFDGSVLDVDNFNIRHDNQFVIINGKAGSDPADQIVVSLADIDIQLIFDILNINYVDFGGIATGRVVASDLFSGRPVAQTEYLHVVGLKYNGCEVGDADLSARWNHDEMMVEMGADVVEEERHAMIMKGGIWVTRDSLSLDFTTDKLRVAFLKPFMQTFAEKVDGRASGHLKLYGTFQDIDMKGRVMADSFAVKIGFTNVEYHCADSVIIDPGRIQIRPMKLYDKFGHSATFSGELTHRYFHDAYFDFRISDARSMLMYNTNERHNPVWYGTVFASGTGAIQGRPGFVNLLADMTTEQNTTFTFVLTDRQDVADYTFLTFSDRRRAEEEAKRPPTEENMLDRYLRDHQQAAAQQQGPPTVFAMNLQLDVTPAAKCVIVMDQAGGDRIQARGDGNITVGYSSDTDLMTMYGRYNVQEGTYKFTLQDLILKDFTIRQGSYIQFNGDPLNADLAITAAYRVNTNLTDLDNSFANDKELNRTNVPVDALLHVDGALTHPSVKFDISLPTLTEETARKVRSIISTEDMMSRQIIYLLALNRFYTPEYMGVSSNGGEWASVASSTLSSQLSNIMGQLTDKVSLMPSFRSDKGDFSDMEVDLALSSRLFNNRLLINGNFGYRDRSTSNTTFVGDFDIEYLLNKQGTLRLKAYNHFNDQNYYLKSALTTQGIGVIYRKDFDNPITFLRPKKAPVVPKDSVPAPDSTK